MTHESIGIAKRWWKAAGLKPPPARLLGVIPLFKINIP